MHMCILKRIKVVIRLRKGPGSHVSENRPHGVNSCLGKVACFIPTLSMMLT